MVVRAPCRSPIFPKRISLFKLTKTLFHTAALGMFSKLEGVGSSLLDKARRGTDKDKNNNKDKEKQPGLKKERDELEAAKQELEV